MCFSTLAACRRCALLDRQRQIDRRIRDATAVHPDISRGAPWHARVDDVGPKLREDVESIDDRSRARGDLVGVDVIRAPLDVLLRRDLHGGKRARRRVDHDANRDRVARRGEELLAALKADSSRDDLVVAAVARNVERPLAGGIRRSAGDRRVQTTKRRDVGVRDGRSRACRRLARAQRSRARAATQGKREHQRE